MKIPRINEIENYLLGRYDIRINVITNTIESKPKAETTYNQVSEMELKYELYKEGQSKFDGELKAILGSKAIQKFDPIKEYFETLPKWNDTEPDYIKALSSYCQTDDQPWFEYMFKKHLVRMVAQATNKIEFNKHCLTLVGKQNDGKTSFFNFLVPPALKNYYRDTFDFNGSKDGKFSLVQNFLINLDELAQFDKKDLNKEFKSILTTSIVKFRLLFHNSETPHLRRASFVATTNEIEFLTDETGNVRWIPFVVKSINHDFGGKNGYSANIDIDKVWGQAYSLLMNGFKCQLDNAEINQLEILNRRFIKVSTEADVISRFLKPAQKHEQNAEFLQSFEICQYLKQETTLVLHSNQVGKALTQLGFERTSHRNEKWGVKGYFVLKIENILTTLTTNSINN